jgi:hypothetical protein
VVELRDRQAGGVPGLAAVHGHVDAAVVAAIIRFGFFGSIHTSWWSPWWMPFTRFSRAAAVDRLQHRHLREPHDVGVARIDVSVE